MKPGPKRKPIEERFWEKVDVRGEGECWEWKASFMDTGYGQIGSGGIGGTMLAAHRVSWTIHFGEIPIHNSHHGMCVLHTCDNRKCVNPNHLFLGTVKDNADDKVRKGRQSRGTHRPLSKLNPEKVRSIRKMCVERKLPQSRIAKIYGVNQGTISDIHTRKLWRWLDD